MEATKAILSPQEVADAIKSVCGERLAEVRLTEWAEGVKKNKSRQVWLRMDRDCLRPALKKLITLQYPHLGVISCVDIGDSIELLYHFFIYYGMDHQEIMVTFTLAVPKSDPTVPTITDLIPGALTSEREKQEMIGLKVVNIPDDRRLFLPDDFPQGVYPWRKDETGAMEGLVKELWKTGREKMSNE
ncbi:MAG: NADH-quinone oxidoreductase subunit C [Lentisphaerota bacterium]